MDVLRTAIPSNGVVLWGNHPTFPRTSSLKSQFSNSEQSAPALASLKALLDDTAADPLADEEPVLAALTAASMRGPPPEHVRVSA